MQFTKLVPNIFYSNIQQGLKLWVDCLEFKIEHKELHNGSPFCVIGRNGLRIHLFEDASFASPEFRLVTENIEEVHQHIAEKFPEYLHPNLPTITLRPWGAKEFAVKDGQLGIVFQEFVNKK